MVKVKGVSGTTAAHDVGGASVLSHDEQKFVTDLLTAERQAQAAMKKAAADYGDQPTIRAKYIAPRPDIVAKYICPPPHLTFDAHVAVINNMTKNRIVSEKEAKILRKIFNHDIEEAQSHGRDIKPKVREYLNKALKGLKIGDKAHEEIFGAGGPAEQHLICAIIGPFVGKKKRS